MNPIYMVIIILCNIACIAMICHIQSSTAIAAQEKKWSTLLFCGLLIGASMELLGVWMDTRQMGMPLLRMLIKLLEFCVIPMLSPLLAFGCRMKKQAKVIWFIGLAHILVELVLAPFGKIITVDALGVYHRGEWYALYIAVYVVALLYLLWIFIALSKQFHHMDRKTIFCVLLLILGGALPALINSSVRTSFFGTVMGIIILYLYYEGLTLQSNMDQLSSQSKRIEQIQNKVIMGIADLIESRDESTGTHVKDTAAYAAILAEAAREQGIYPDVINEKFVADVVRATPLHDVGKIVISDNILLKPGKLTDEEFESMKCHTSEGGRIVRQLLDGITDDEYVRIAVDIASHHHEKWNGKGYPDGLAGEEIPVAARIVAIADVYDALVAERVYKKAFSPEKALSIIETDSGSHFDPVLGPLFVRKMRES